MSSPKERKKARRRAEKLMDQAIEAVVNDELTLATKLSHRAIALGDVNPRLWLDHGRVLLRTGDFAAASEAMRHAIALAPTYAEAFAELAQLQAQRGKLAAAIRLQTKVVELLPADAQQQARLAGFQALLDEDGGASEEGAADPTAAANFTDRTERYDWNALEAGLRSAGMTVVPNLLTGEECEELIAMWSTPDPFEHEVSLDDASGKVAYRFFTRPLPPLVAALRAEMYARLAPIANDWNEGVRRKERFPAELPEFEARCHDAGQTRTTPILLRYPEGGFNGAHRDVSGRVVFPFQLAVTLGPSCTASHGGGELRLVDERPGKKVRERRLATGVGDGVVFCTRERPVKIAGVTGLQPVLHAVSEVVGAERFALGLPFHEHG